MFSFPDGAGHDVSLTKALLFLAERVDKRQRMVLSSIAKVWAK